MHKNGWKCEKTACQNADRLIYNYVKYVDLLRTFFRLRNRKLREYASGSESVFIDTTYTNNKNLNKER